MSKYDFEVDLSQNSSVGIILEQINKGAVVLEFGCAMGRMTRYMKDVLGCQVYIVEYDKNAYEVALQYAEGGLCDDIMKFQWTEKFKEIEFDSIIFADVLEHLSSPEKVIECASKLLKNTGRIFLSVPNITHNDIILKAYEEHFDYTSIGLLDDTHIHFWGLENIKELPEKCGLNIRKITGTFCPTGYTEQYEQAGAGRYLLLENMLRERQCGEVYQFVVTLDKERNSEIECTFKQTFIQSHVYLDTGKGFNADEIIDVDSEYTEQGSYKAHLVIPNAGSIQRVRFDPIEFQGCILKVISISQGEEKLKLIYNNALELNEGLLLLGNDPMVYAKIGSQDAPIIIDAEIIIAGEKYLDILYNACVENYTECTELARSVASLKENEENLQKSVRSLMEEQENLQRGVTKLTGANEEMLKEIVQLSGNNADLNRDLCAYIVLANNKEKYSIELEKALENKAQYALDLEQMLKGKESYILDLEAALNYYKSIRVVRLQAYIGRIWRGIKRRLKRVIRKEEHE